MFTKAFKRAEELYRWNNLVTVIGNPGDGKTMIAVQLLLRLKEEGETIVVLTDPNLIEQIYESNTRVVFFVDDAFGAPTINKALVDTWTRLYDKLECLVEAKKCGLILTSRKQVLMQCDKLLHKCTGFKNNVVDISYGPEQFSPQERTLIASRYIKGANCLNQKYSVKIPVTKYIPGFPLMCKMYSTSGDLREKGSDFFENPILFLKEQIEHLVWSDQTSYCGLVLVTMFDGRLSRDVFDEFDEPEPDVTSKLQAVMKCCGLNPMYDKSKIESALNNMEGVFVEVLEDDFIFLHSAINDAVCFVFGKRRTKEILKVASAKFVEQRIRTKDSIGETDQNDVIVLQKNRYPDLAKRWIRDMKEGNLSSVYDNPSFDDDDMNEVFMEEIRNISSKDIWQLMNMKDKKRKMTYMSLICSAGLESNLVAFIDQLVQSKFSPEGIVKTDVLVEALLELVQGRYSKAIEGLINLNVIDVNYEFPSKQRRLVHAVASYGDAGLLDILLRRGASITIRDDSGALPVHYAAEQKSVDSLDVLIRHGAKINVFESSGRLPIHYAARNGRFECVQRLIESDTHLEIKDLNEREPIHDAAANKDARVLELLLEKGSSVNRLDIDGRTPLHHACKALQLNNIKTLTESGAKTQVHDAHGNLPIHLVCDDSKHHNTLSYYALNKLLDDTKCINTQNDEREDCPPSCLQLAK